MFGIREKEILVISTGYQQPYKKDEVMQKYKASKANAKKALNYAETYPIPPKVMIGQNMLQWRHLYYRDPEIELIPIQKEF